MITKILPTCTCHLVLLPQTQRAPWTCVHGYGSLSPQLASRRLRVAHTEQPTALLQLQLPSHLSLSRAACNRPCACANPVPCVTCSIGCNPPAAHPTANPSCLCLDITRLLPPGCCHLVSLAPAAVLPPPAATTAKQASTFKYHHMWQAGSFQAMGAEAARVPHGTVQAFW